MNIILCDDELLFLSSLEQKIGLWAQKSGHANNILISKFTSGEDMLDAWEHGMQIDALFLDIVLPGEMNGLSAAKQIRATNDYIPIVFITGFAQYAEEGFEVNALRYLRKPVTEDAVSQCMDIIWRRWALQNLNSVVLDLPTQILRLPAAAIMYAEISGHNCSVFTIDRENPYVFRQSIDYLRQKLSLDQFAQCHRSFLVNLMYVRHLTGNQLLMSDGTVIQIGRKYKSDFMLKFRKYYLGGENSGQ
ncbi:MAG: response regulator transcription factor [Clostridia bacterium]|nr:response regulator transcription factor [Clostridia bacterium]